MVALFVLIFTQGVYKFPPQEFPGRIVGEIHEWTDSPLAPLLLFPPCEERAKYLNLCPFLGGIIRKEGPYTRGPSSCRQEEQRRTESKEDKAQQDLAGHRTSRRLEEETQYGPQGSDGGLLLYPFRRLLHLIHGLFGLIVELFIAYELS